MESAPNTDLVQFLNEIYGTTAGFCYLATKTPVDSTKSVKDTKWGQEFFQWPEQQNEVISFIQSHSSTHEVYFAPALFKRAEAKKDAVLGSTVFWCEFDGKVPTGDALKGVPEPSIKVQSSLDGHEHWYWKTEALVTPEVLEDVNRKLTYSLGADTSGWDASQVLRPIGTHNHKRDRPVQLKSISGNRVSLSDFLNLPKPPPVAEVPEVEDIPAIEDVTPKYKFTEEVWQLFKGGLSGDRSNDLMSLGYFLAEMQLQNSEMFAMLLNADERWGKFAGRSDQHRRLMEIVVRARTKYPLHQSADGGGAFESLGFSSLLAKEEKVEWLWDGLLHKSGYMLVTGPSGVGKSQFTLNAAARLVLGQGFIGRQTFVTDAKIGFFSLEMGLEELKEFVVTQAAGYTSEEIGMLEERLRFFPLGEPIYLTRDEEKDRIEEVIQREGLTGVIFDSLGSVTESSLSNEENVKNLMDWNDRLRRKYNIFTWYIHHHRKASGDNKKPNKIGDVYGSQYITARASSILALWDVGQKDTIQCIPLKIRLAKKPGAFNMFRDENLHFHAKASGITIVAEGESADEVLEEILEDTGNIADEVSGPPTKTPGNFGF